MNLDWAKTLRQAVKTQRVFRAVFTAPGKEIGCGRDGAASQAAKEQADWDFNRLGDAQQCLDGNDFFAAFNFAQILRVQIHLFRQFFLGESGLFAAKANGVTQNFPVTEDRLSLFFGLCHKGQRVGRLDSTITPATCWYFYLLAIRRHSQNHGPANWQAVAV